MSVDPPSEPDDPVEEAPDQASRLRSRIDRVDRELVALLADRARLIERLIALPSDPAPEREERMLRAIARRRAWAAKAGLDRGFTEVLFAILLARDVAVQTHRRELPQVPLRAAEPVQPLPNPTFQTQG